MWKFLFIVIVCDTDTKNRDMRFGLWCINKCFIYCTVSKDCAFRIKKVRNNSLNLLHFNNYIVLSFKNANFKLKQC